MKAASLATVSMFYLSFIYITKKTRKQRLHAKLLKPSIIESPMFCFDKLRKTLWTNLLL
jgi:hypothetical protein